MCLENAKICDSKYGCTENGTTYDWKTISTSVSNSDDYATKESLLAFCCFMVLLLLGVIIYFYHELRKRNMAIGRSSATFVVRDDIQEDGVYTDVREPIIHDQSRNFDLPTYFCDNTETNRMDTAKSKILSQVRLKSTRPETLDSNEFEYDYCNRLNSQSSSPIYSSVIKHDKDLTGIQSSKTLSESKLKDNNFSQHYKENDVCVNDQYEEFQPMMNRPYSSVKYDRKTTTDNDYD